MSDTVKQTAATHRSLERGLAVLEAVASAPGPASLADTARRLGLHRSTVHHLMQALTSLGWLRQLETTRAYELTQKLYQLTGSRWSAEQLGEIAQPYLEALTREAGEGSSLAGWKDGVVTLLAKHDDSGPVRVVQDVGGRRPMYCTAVGKALAGWLPANELKRALDATRFTALTPKTITTRAGFEAELRRIRAAGYAVDDEEQFPGLRCVAMPVFCFSGDVVASMCVLGPKQRMTTRKMQAVREPLALQARRLSERLGAPPDLQRVIGRADLKRAR